VNREASEPVVFTSAPLLQKSVVVLVDDELSSFYLFKNLIHDCASFGLHLSEKE